MLNASLNIMKINIFFFLPFLNILMRELIFNFVFISDKRYARVVFTSVDSSNLYSLEHIKSMCLHEEYHLRVHEPYADKCIKPTGQQECCRSWCLGSYIALLTNRSSCKHVTGQDVGDVLDLLKSCAPFYQNYTIGPNCDYSPDAWFFDADHNSRQKVCPGVPKKCVRYNAVFHILHYLVDRNFMEEIAAGKQTPHLSYAITFLPLTVSSASVDIYEYIESLPKTFNGVQIVGAKFEVKFTLFEKYLKSDSIWLACAGCAIFMAMWLFSASVFITVMTFLAVFWALTVAYFLYMFVFEIKFFPYMNMVTVIVMIGIGADDVFIYCKVWHLSKSEPNNGALEKIITDTLRHATLSMLVTSLTTAASFYANSISDVTAIQCFSIYAGTAVLCNFVLTITWIPATIMLYEKWCNFCSCYNPGVYISEDGCCSALCRLPCRIYYFFSEWSRIFFEKLLPCLVIRLRYLWLLLLGCLGVCGFVVIFYYPKLKLPSTNQFQVFSSDHWLEKYDFELSEKFAFEKMSEDEIPLLPITVIWGVHATDTGDPLNPRKKGTLVFDENFDLAEKASQVWILKFCSRLRRTDFYLNSPGMQLTNCFLENFVHGFMKQSCKGNYPCCNQTKFPYSKADFNHCLRTYVPILHRTPSAAYSSYSPGPRFSDGRVSAFVVEFLSNEPFSQNYMKMKMFYQHINRWMTDEMLQAPKEMRNGWFISDLSFYDLQNSLAVGTPLALGVSLAVAAVVAFFTTLNILISLYAIFTVMFIIVVTIAGLVLQGWELNIMESVVVTVVIGMSIDFTLHYGVAYRLSPDLDREMRVACSVSRMGSAIAMAAFTTFLAGVFMLPSTVLVYRKFGIFLMILISASWIYSTFFFQSLLRIIGPQGGFSQFHWPASDCCSSSPHEHVDKTVYALSESTLSSSSTSNPNHMSSSEIHELEPLSEGKEPVYQTQRPSQHLHNYHYHHPQHRARSIGAYTHMKPKGSSDSTSGGDSRTVTFEPTVNPRSPEVIIEQPEMEQTDSRKTSSSSHPSTECYDTKNKNDIPRHKHDEIL